MFNRKIKFPTDFWEDTQNRLEFIPGKMPPASVKITAVKAFLISNKKLLLVDISRGWDIPTGHINENESPEQALIREVMEEAEIIVRSSIVLGYLKSLKIKENSRNHIYPKLSAILVYGSRDFRVTYPFKGKFESRGRKFFPFNEVENAHKYWSSMMKAIFAYALDKLDTNITV